MRLLNTLTRQQADLAPLDGHTLRFYCCGPTVYGPAHIGNFRTFLLQDVFRRTLELSGTPTFHVRNLTDLDDKTIRDSQAAGLPLSEFTDLWRDRFHADAAALDLLPPHVEPSAVAHIPHQIQMIETLIDRGHAYQAADHSVYFKLASFPSYGRLSQLDQRQLAIGKTREARARDADEYDKEDAADFVLWKARRPEDGDNFWPSPWGDGRPGWHLECSAMCLEYLGDSFDLHSGGVDLVFPHHENEIAQSCCATSGSFARHWFHITHLMVDGGKMSKSLGNLYTLDDVIQRGHSPQELRYVLVSGYYRRPLNFTLDSLHDAHAALLRIAKFDAALAAAGAATPPDYATMVAAPPPAGPFAPALEALHDDLNTPKALGALFTALREIKPASLSPADASATRAALHRILACLGLSLPALPSADEPSSPEIPAEVQELATRRWIAKAQRDWPTADLLRDQIQALGWQIKDAPDTYHLTPHP